MTFVFAFVGVPGGIEMVIMMLIGLFMFALPLVAAVAIAVYLYRRASSSDHAEAERIAELEREVAELRERVEDRD